MRTTLDGLERQYGRRPSILATRADYTSALGAQKRMLRAAYAAAEGMGDGKNMVLVAESLIERFLDGQGRGGDVVDGTAHQRSQAVE